MSKLRPTQAFLKRLEFLSTGRTYLKKDVKIITFSYDTWRSESAGVRRFIAKKLPPLQFKNPNVQVVLFKNRHPFPAIWIYFKDGSKVMVAVEGKSPDKIMDELTAVAAKTEAEVQEALRKAEYNPSLFGDGRKGRFCICEIPGQVPCPRLVPIKNVEHPWHDKDNQS